MSVDEINKLFKGYKTLQKEGMSITQETYEEKMRGVLGELDSDLGNLDEILYKNFSDILTDEKKFAEQ